MNKKINMPLIALAAGGTGGHMFPASALADELMARGYKIMLITDKRGMAYEHIFKKCTVECIISSSPMQGGFANRINSLLSLIKGSFRAAKLIKKHKAKAVIGFGGYPSLPAVIGGRLSGVHYGLHEQNAVLGKVNRLLVGGASFLATSFENTRRIKEKQRAKVKLIGNPTRQVICRIGEAPYQLPNDNEAFNILAVGGSLGATVFADIIPAAVTFLDDEFKNRLFVTQQCRAEDKQRVEKAYKRSGIKFETSEFIEDMAAALEKAHLIISRSGAGSVAEVALAARPAIFVPLAIAADNHQTFNARSLSEKRAGWLLQEHEFSPGPLAALIGGLLTASDQLDEAAGNARLQARPNATKDLANLVEEAFFKDKKHKEEKEAEKTTSQKGKNKNMASTIKKRVAA
jgi:UDP-N-acetylglucosamine--N-acetylmuramyl-(pentapeptide) pyrophosphoryl-undecaprenol N-acetylglucosamine transferase